MPPAAVILAGGEARRLCGIDKPLPELGAHRRPGDSRGRNQQFSF
jgi:molybdopterin-guanine dinucleotide biosynthesis protein A